MQRAAVLALALCCAALPAQGRAQADDRDPLLDAADEPAPSAWSFLFGDALLRYDRVDHLANRPDGVERVRSRARLGALWLGAVGAALALIRVIGLVGLGAGLVVGLVVGLVGLAGLTAAILVLGLEGSVAGVGVAGEQGREGDADDGQTKAMEV